MKRMCVAMAALALLCVCTTARAVVMETVRVGDAGNAGDTRYGNAYQGSGPASYGAVSYAYKIDKYEVTAGQYCEFLNAKAKTDTYGLYNTSMWSNAYGCKIQRSGTSGGYTYSVASDYANRPVNFVSCWDACRFANWLNNGQGIGDTETGAYTLGGYNGTDGYAIQRNAGWKCAVTSEDEWYKAAYYKGGNTDAGYWDYATRSNTAPNNQVLGTDTGNSANYYISNYSIGSPYYRTNVGEFENSASAYGTYDQGGNVWEWNEGQGSFRGLRGSSFMNNQSNFLSASSRSEYFNPTTEGELIGLRVVQAVPEPSSLIALGALLAPLLAFRRRKG